MGCPPVRGDNPRALASGLPCVHVDEHGFTILYHLISEDLAHHLKVHAEVGKGGIHAVMTSYVGLTINAHIADVNFYYYKECCMKK